MGHFCIVLEPLQTHYNVPISKHHSFANRKKKSERGGWETEAVRRGGVNTTKFC